MKVENENIKKVLVEDLREGDCFMCDDGSFYVRISPKCVDSYECTGEYELPALNLKEYEIEVFPKKSQVTKVNAKIVIG